MITHKQLTNKLNELNGLIDWIQSTKVTRIPDSEKVKAICLIDKAHSSLDDVLYIYQEHETIESQAKALSEAIKQADLDYQSMGKGISLVNK